jgi:hypothetical protein
MLLDVCFFEKATPQYKTLFCDKMPIKKNRVFTYAVQQIPMK